MLIMVWGYTHQVKAQTDELWDEKGYSTYRDTKFDTNIVNSYEHLFGLEVMLQNKELDITYRAIEKANDLSYRPNTNIALGLGFTYRYLALSAAVNLFPSKRSEGLKTRSFDFQSQLAGQRNLTFITAQLYKGMYSNYDPYRISYGTDYQRPDVGFTLLGLNNMYALNKRYSFRGSVLRFQRMRYSVGTPILSLDGNYLVKSGETPFIPKQFESSFEELTARRYRIWNIGLGGGYAYTWHINENWLLAGIATVKLPINFVNEGQADGSSKEYLNTGLNGSLWMRTSYERDIWSISLHYIHSKMLIGNEFFQPQINGSYGMARLIFSRRFGIDRKFKKALRPLDAILDIPVKILSKKK